RGPGARRELRLALPGLARRLLPPGSRAAPRARVRRRAPDVDRDQRLVLLPAAPPVGSHTADKRLFLPRAAPPVVRRMASRRAGGVRVRGQGPALRQPSEAPQGRRGPVGELLRLRRARPWTEAGAGPVAAAGELPLRRGRAGRLPGRP